MRAQILNRRTGLRVRHGLSHRVIGHDLQLVRALTDRVLVRRAGRHPETRARLAASPQLHPITG